MSFGKEGGKVVGELKLRVAYSPAYPPSPVPEEPEEESSPRHLWFVMRLKVLSEAVKCSVFSNFCFSEV